MRACDDDHLRPHDSEEQRVRVAAEDRAPEVPMHDRKGTRIRLDTGDKLF
jgi:hypothetical protein